MPRFKNTDTVPRCAGDGIWVAPGEFVTVDEPSEDIERDLTPVPDDPKDADASETPKAAARKRQPAKEDQ